MVIMAIITTAGIIMAVTAAVIGVDIITIADGNLVKSLRIERAEMQVSALFF